MSYNITATKILQGKISLTKGACKKLVLMRRKLEEDWVPEYSILDEIDFDSSDIDAPSFKPPVIEPFALWGGEGSGHSFDVFKDQIMPLLGNVTIRVVWEGGDAVEKYAVKDGVVTLVETDKE